MTPLTDPPKSLSLHHPPNHGIHLQVGDVERVRRGRRVRAQRAAQEARHVHAETLGADRKLADGEEALQRDRRHMDQGRGQTGRKRRSE
jgi:hypothetical protein